jgi:DNA-binding CsgD family transcriptional regulator
MSRGRMLVPRLGPGLVVCALLSCAGGLFASRLFVTRATVESQLYSSYRKLGITSRAQLATALAEFQ